MRLETDAIVCSLISHGEHGAVVRLLTPDDGLVAAYVRGGRGRRMRPVLIPGNNVAAQLRSRTEGQLPQAALELAHSRAPMLTEALALAAIEWATVLVSTALPERQPYPRIYQALHGLLDAVEAAPSASGWGLALARFEALVISELGYGREGAEQTDVLKALDSSGEQLFADVLPTWAVSLQDSRSRLIERLRRALV